MIAAIIEWSVRNRFFVLLLTVMLATAGAWALRSTPVDAIPDLSDVQVIILTDFPGQDPQTVEDQVTYPLATAMLAVPYAVDVRGYSFFGFSLLYVIFEDGTDLYWARSRVLEYLNFARSRLPEGVTPQLGPDATGVGWVFEYSITDFSPRAEVLRERLDADGDGEVSPAELPAPRERSRLPDGTEVEVYAPERLRELFTVERPPGPGTPEAFAERSVEALVEAFDRDLDGRTSADELRQAANFRGLDLSELRSIQDWYLKYDLMSVPGVAEVASLGGFVRQIQVVMDPERMRAYGVGIADVRRAVQRANVEVGGRLLEMGETEYMIRGRGYVRSVDDIEQAPVGLDPETHIPILLKQVAHVQLGPEIRRGIAEMNGMGEVVTGIVLLRFGENALEVIDRVKERLEELRPGLPPGVEIHVSYDRSTLIHRAIETLTDKLVEEMVVVAVVTVVFLLHLPSALVAILTLPVGVLSAFLLMRGIDLNSNIMSLGGIALAIGVMVDAAVVMVENLHKHLEHHPERSRLENVVTSAREVGPALFFSLLIVTVSFLPVFTLEAQEGRLFKPLAWTKTLAMASASLLSITTIPALMLLLVRGRIRSEADNPISRLAIAAYEPVIHAVLAYPRTTVLLALLLAAATTWPARQLGSEFMPPLNEGDLLYMPTTPPGISITKARELLQQTDKLIAKHPQVKHVLGKIGRAETATDPAPLTMIETTIQLTPQETWPEGKTIEDITRELDAMVQFPGLTNAWTMPIKTRIDMLATGIKTPVGIKLMGDDLEVLSEVGQRIEAVLQEVPGTASVYSERVTGGNFIDIDIRRQDAARYGLDVADVQDVVRSALGGMNVSWTVEGLERYPINLRYPRELRNDLTSLRNLAVPTPMGHTVPLAQVADIRLTRGPPAIKSENARRTAWIYVDLKTSDIGGYVARAREVVASRVALPPGVSIKWSGQYEYMARAKEKLSVVVPLTLGIIFILLYLHFRDLAETTLVMLSLPVALTGGVWLLWALDYNVSVAVAVGFIALAGLAAETAVVMLVYLDEAWERFREEGRLRSLDDLKEAIHYGAVQRVRPKLMTVACLFFGLLPIMEGHGAGSRVMKRIAAPMVGGLVSSTILTLVVVPAVYLLWRSRRLRRA